MKCTAHSARSGKPCNRDAIKGATVCYTHGGAAPQVREAAKLRLLAASDPAAKVLVDQLHSRKATPADKRAAAIAILDRAGLKPTDKLELSGPNGGPIPIADLSKCSIEELEMLQKLSERLKGSAPAATLPSEDSV